MIGEAKMGSLQEELVLQNFLFKYDRIPYESLWGQGSVNVSLKKEGLEALCLQDEGILTFDSLANSFPVGFFSVHSQVSYVFLESFISANEAELSIFHEDLKSKIRLIHQEKYRSRSGMWKSPPIPLNAVGGRYWFEVRFRGRVQIENTSWVGILPHSRNPAVLLSITAFKRDDYVLPLVKDLCDYEPLKSLNISFLVIDNGLTLSRVQLPEDPRVVLIPQTNLGCTSGFMRGLVEAESRKKEILVIADDDIVMPPETLYRMLVFQAVSSRPIAVGASMIVVRKPFILWEQGGVVRSGGVNSLKTFNKGLNLESKTERSKTYLDRNPDYTALWLLSAPTQFLSYLPSLFIYYEDILQCLLLKKKGLNIVVPPHIFLWHATLEKQGALWKRYLWLRNDLATRFLIHEKLVPINIAVSFIRLIIKILVSFDYRLAELHLRSFEEAISGPNWTTDPLGQSRFVQALIRENPSLEDLSSQLSKKFLLGETGQIPLGKKIIKRLKYFISCGNYINPLARSFDDEGKLAFRRHGDYEGWGWTGFKKIAVVDREGRGYVCERSWKKMLPLLGRSFVLSWSILWKSRKLQTAYIQSLKSCESAWKEVFSQIERI